MLLILTGPVHSGKTTRLGQLVTEWRSQRFLLDGYLSPAVFESGQRIGYDWFDLGTGRNEPFLRCRGEADWERVGPYFIVPSTLEKAKAKIRDHDSRRFLILDEIGPLELRGAGVWPSLKAALSRRSLGCLLVVREEILGRFRRVAPVQPERVFRLEESGLAAALAGAFRDRRKPAGGGAPARGSEWGAE